RRLLAQLFRRGQRALRPAAARFLREGVMAAHLRGVVSAPQPLAVEVGAQILAAGGNAVDAAIAAALVQGVVDPQMCGIGGGGSATVFDAGSGTTSVCDFYAPAPLAARPDMFADRIVGTAGWGGFILSDRSN